MQGVWGNGAFGNMEDLCKTMKKLVFILTNINAAANFSQHNEYEYPPNFSLRLGGVLRTHKVSNLRLKMTQKTRKC